MAETVVEAPVIEAPVVETVVETPVIETPVVETVVIETVVEPEVVGVCESAKVREEVRWSPSCEARIPIAVPTPVVVLAVESVAATAVAAVKAWAAVACIPCARRVPSVSSIPSIRRRPAVWHRVVHVLLRRDSQGLFARRGPAHELAWRRHRIALHATLACASKDPEMSVVRANLRRNCATPCR